MQQILTQMLKPLLLIFLLFGAVQSLSQFANYPLMTNIKTGDHKLLQVSTNVSGVITANQSYFSAFSKIPAVVISIRDMQISGTSISGSIDYVCTITAVTSSKFTTNLNLTAGTNTFTLLYYMYLAIDNTSLTDSYIFPYSFNWSSQFNDSNRVFLVNQTTNNIVDYSNAVVVPFPMSFGMNTTHQYSFFVSAVMLSSTTTQLNITSNSKLYRMELAVIIIDKTKLEANYTNFVDFGTVKTTQSGAVPTSTYNPPSAKYFNFIIGLGQFRVDLSKDISFFYWTNNTLRSTTQFKYLSYFALQWRFRQCGNTSNTSARYFVLQKQLCYDTCPTGYAPTNSSIDYCVKCSYKCDTCLQNGSCKTCSSSSSRNTSNNCECLTSFYQDGNITCPICHFSCLTCNTSATNCLTCTNTRSLISNACPCLTGFYQKNVSTCSACDYTCLTCVGTSTNCTSCDETNNFRYYDTVKNTCTCKSRFQDNGLPKCITSQLVCQSPCVSCNGTATNCLSCITNRILTNNACPCKTGFTASNDTVPCFQACGTGEMIPNSSKQCDDGDNLEGDGCSADCKIQTNFVCDNTAMPSVCTSKLGYSFSTQSVTKDLTSNTLTTVLTIDPIPPSSSIPSLLNLQDSLSMISYSLNRGTLTLKLNLYKTLDSNSQLKVQLSKINSVAGVSLSSTSNVQLIPYVESYYTLYNIEAVLVWIYIGAIWLLSLYRIITEPSLISQVCQVFVYSSLAWIGVQGQQNPMLLFIPIQNLRFIFGYNLQLDNSSLFSVFNLSFLYLAFPFLMFAILLFLSKKKPGLVTSKIKRFVLYDLAYAWITVNGFLLAYGVSLSVTSSNSLSGADIAGILIFVAYLVVMAVVSFRSFFRGAQAEQINPTLEYTKKNLFKQRAYPVYLFSSIIMSFIYLVLQKYTQINPLFMIAYFLVMMVVFGVGNVFINKVRNLLNLINLLLIYCCYLLINQVSSATWTGFVVLALLFIQLITNFIVMYFEKNNLRIDPDDDILKDKAKPQDDLNPRENHQQSDRGVIQLEQHVGVFTIYEPPTPKKDRLELMIPPAQFYQQGQPILTGTQDIKADRERITEMKKALNEYLLTSPKYRGEAELPKDEPQDIVDISMKVVEMNQF